MVTEPTAPQEDAPEANTFLLPDATRARITMMIQERQALDLRINEIISTAMEVRGIIGATSPNYDLGTGVVTYQPMLSTVSLNRAQRRRAKATT